MHRDKASSILSFIMWYYVKNIIILKYSIKIKINLKKRYDIIDKYEIKDKMAD